MAGGRCSCGGFVELFWVGDGVGVFFVGRDEDVAGGVLVSMIVRVCEGNGSNLFLFVPRVRVACIGAVGCSSEVVGSFGRALLEVDLTAGFTVGFGSWSFLCVSIHFSSSSVMFAFFNAVGMRLTRKSTRVRRL